MSEHFPFYWPLGASLHWAIVARSWKGVYLLLELDADINALDLPHEEKGQSALAIVTYRNDAEMVENLLARGADPA